MKKVEEKLKELGIELSESPTPLGAYRPAVVSGNLVFVSGQLPLKEGKLVYKGKLGAEVSVEDGMQAARLAAINSLSVLKSELGDLNKIKGVIKMTGYVASAAGFDMQAKVLNGASELFYDVFGEMGKHARAAVGVYELPLGAPVEIEIIAEIS
jgi:Putative translation initiation inhibitor, yjgF family